MGADTLGTLNEDASFTVVDENREEDTDLDTAAEDASIIRFVNQVLRDAIELRASDIHLEPFEEEFRIRYRIDGVLQDVPVPKLPVSRRPSASTTTVPAHSLFAPARAWVIAAARVIPGVCGVLRSSSSDRTTRMPCVFQSGFIFVIAAARWARSDFPF